MKKEKRENKGTRVDKDDNNETKLKEENKK